MSGLVALVLNVEIVGILFTSLAV
jgi:hypothetical protein